MSAPRFFVVARVVGRDGAIGLWRERLIHLCEVSATEPYGDSYYWGADLDGEPDTLWGLEGYTHPVGFFLDHVSSDIFKREMALVDKDELLRHQQGLGSPDYDLHHYDEEGGWLKLANDLNGDSKTSHVAVYHFWATTEQNRSELLSMLSEWAEQTKTSQGPDVTIHSALVLRECRDRKLATLWLRVRDVEAFKQLQSSGTVADLLKQIKSLCAKTEIHQSKSFNGHLNLQGKIS